MKSASGVTKAAYNKLRNITFYFLHQCEVTCSEKEGNNHVIDSCTPVI